jgi:hypothetical protein
LVAAVVALIMMTAMKTAFKLTRDINAGVLVVEVPELLYNLATDGPTYPHARELVVHVVSIVAVFALTAEAIGTYVAGDQVALAQHRTVSQD